VGHPKGTEFANLALDTVEPALTAAAERITRIRQGPRLLFSFLDHTGSFR
jgi:hypothetical protein